MKELVTKELPTGRALLVFKAPWCGPCRAMEPVLRNIAGDSDRVIAIDTDEHGDIASRFNVRSVPVMLVVDDGMPVKRVDGAATASVIQSLVEMVDG